VINIHTKPLDEEAIIIGKNKMHRYSWRA
jgi:hypothetical protein